MYVSYKTLSSKQRALDKQNRWSRSWYNLLGYEEGETTLLLEVYDTIRADFDVLYEWQSEEGYHAELANFLHERYDVEIESVRGGSQPDITISDLAIEVKGPTKAQSLDSLPDKP